ncbi:MULTISPECIES: hypothetical protein [Haloarcula]|uniref:hypothetical protein n=1 Tax=Haloarcula TaxID=2237 RepID=UPI0023ED7C04|nr:hypothetical protein [Halomicroarcula sp. XH51]
MASPNTKAYYALVEDIVVDQKAVWGTVAVDIADSVPGLVVDTGTIWINGHETEVVGALARAYVDRFGRAAAESLRDVAEDYQDEVDLPPVLERGE